jgi:hypothetical protein
MEKLFLTTVIVSLCLPSYSCDSRKRAIEAHLKENEPALHSLEIMEVSKLDSIYSPYNDAMWLSVQYSTILVKMSELRLSAVQATSKKETLRLLYEVVTVGHSYSLDSLVHDLFKEIDFPELSKKTYNRVGYKAKYRLNGILTENTFYLNKNKNTIGHTDKDIRKYGNEILEYIRKRNDIENKTKTDIADYESGRYYLRNWRF